MGAIQKAIQEVRYEIPEEILTEVFVRREFGRTAIPVSVDTMIREKVINPRVLVDCNLLGGTQVELPLNSIIPERVDISKHVYRIPMSLTQNRHIARVLSLTMGSNAMVGHNYIGVEGYSQILDAAASVMNSNGQIPIVSTASIRLIADNTVLVNDYVNPPRNSFLRCYLEYDDEMSTLGAATYPQFCRLVELAVKAYIYTNSSLRIGMGQLVGGLELGRFREFVDSYSDANQLYKEYLRDEWTSVMFQDDPRSKMRMLQHAVGGGW